MHENESEYNNTPKISVTEHTAKNTTVSPAAIIQSGAHSPPKNNNTVISAKNNDILYFFANSKISFFIKCTLLRIISIIIIYYGVSFVNKTPQLTG